MTLSASECEDHMDGSAFDIDISQHNETATQSMETCLHIAVGFGDVCDVDCIEASINTMGEPADVVTSTDNVYFGPETNQARYGRLENKLKVSISKLNEEDKLYDKNFFKE